MIAGLTYMVTSALIFYQIGVKVIAVTQKKPAELALNNAAFVVNIIYFYFISG